MLAREGRAPATVLGAAATAASFGFEPWWPGLILWAVFVLVVWVYFERLPKCPPRPNALVCPVNGTISAVDKSWDPWSNRSSLRIRVSVAMPFVWTIWAPTEGKIMDFWTKAAPFEGPAGRPEGEDSPNCYTLLIRTDEGQDARVCVSSTWPVSRLKLVVGPGNRTGQGRRMGFAYFAAYVDLLLEPEAEPSVGVGEAVIAGESVLANFAPR